MNANFKVIEMELYNYKKTKLELELLREEILEETIRPDEVVSNNSIGNTTQSKAIRLCTSLEIIEVSKRLGAIDYALACLEDRAPEKMQLVRLKYFEARLTDKGVMEKLSIDRSTFYRWRREIISLIASRLGWKL